MDTISYHSHINAEGLNCPLPILKAKKQLALMENNQVLKITATDKTSLEDIPAFLQRLGHELIHINDNCDTYSFYIRACRKE